MDLTSFIQRWGYTYGRASLVRFPLEQRWNDVLDFFGSDEKLIIIGGTCLSLLACHYGVCFFLTVLDLYGTPQVLMKYKIQKDKNITVNREKYLKCFAISSLNKFLTCVGVVLLYPAMKYRGMECFHPLPSIPRFFFDYFVMIVVMELAFYYFHRMMHIPFFYKHFHKTHHEWTAPVGWAHIYQHPIDHVFAHIFPLLLPPLVAGAHTLTLWVWCLLFQFGSITHHCGFHFPLLTSPEYHDYHHLKFNENYGSMGWLDGFHGTNKTYLKSIQAKRSFIIYGLTPATEIIPDDGNQKEK